MTDIMARVIYNRFLPFKGYKCINLFGWYFVRKGKTLSYIDINHEDIHTAQMKETLYVGFYLMYVFEWLVRIFGKGNAYRSVSFEREAYDNQVDLWYLTNRRHYAWWGYVRKKNIVTAKERANAKNR